MSDLDCDVDDDDEAATPYIQAIIVSLLEALVTDSPYSLRNFASPPLVYLRSMVTSVRFSILGSGCEVVLVMSGI